MRSLHPDALAALDTGRFGVRQLIRCDMPAGPYAIWNDAYDVVYAGTTYLGAAGRFTIAPLAGGFDLAARSLDIVINGLDSYTASEFESQPYHQRPIVVYEAIVAVGAPQILHVFQAFTGFVDQIVRRERVGGAADLTVKCENAGRELGLKGARVRSDSDQRQIDASDGFFRHVAASVNGELVWGRSAVNLPAQPPRKRFFGLF